MRSVLIVGDEQIDDSKHLLVRHGMDQINHCSDRKAGDSNKIIPHDSKTIVVITHCISHAISHEAQCGQARGSAQACALNLFYVKRCRHYCTKCGMISLSG